jgi:putative ABC transport system permease protein
MSQASHARLALELGLRGFARDLRAGDLRVLILAAVLAVAALTAVGFFATRLEAALKRDAGQLIGGDAVLATDRPAPAEYAQQARRLGLQAVATASFPSMAIGLRAASDAAEPESRLVALKAVEPGYPLRGSLQLFGPGEQPRDARALAPDGVPARGEVWVDPALLVALKLEVGGRLQLGNSQFVVGRVIALESDRGAGFMNFAPRVMIHGADLPATGLVQPASRITYRLIVAGSPAAVREWTRWTEAEIKRGQLRGARLESLDSGRPEMSQTLDRAEGFLRLVALLAAMLAAVAVAIGARRFAEHRVDACALLRTMGAPQRVIAASFALEFGLAALAAGVLGVLLGYGAHFVFAALLSGLIGGTSLPPADWGVAMVALVGVGASFTLLAAFGLPPVLALARVPPLRVIRRDLGPRPLAAWLLSLTALGGFAALLLLMAKDLKLGGIAAGGFAAAWALFALAGFGASRGARLWAHSRGTGAAVALAAKQIAARAAATGVQVAALGIGLLALVLLFLMRGDLIESWRAATPPDAPDRFVINIQPEQAEPFRQRLAEAGVARYDWFPMVRGRLVAINGRAVGPEQFTQDRARRLVDREFNLSHADVLPQHNAVVAGRWYAADAEELSVEEGLAQTLGLKLGDRLEFDLAGQRLAARVTSLRRVDWQSMRVNFFVLFPTRLLQAAPTTYITAFKSPRAGVAGAQFDNALAREFPNVTLVDISASVAQVRRVLDQVVAAVEFLFVFAVAAGLTVLIAALRASEAERMRYVAILRAIGAARRLLERALAAELLLIGALAGLLASGAAGMIGWALAYYVFGFAWTISPWLLPSGAALGAALAFGAGWWQLRAVVRTPVVTVLREAG